MRTHAVLAAAALALVTGACTASHPLDAKDRAVPSATEAIAWHPAQPADLEGYFESERITGEAAGTLRKVFYAFAADRTYSGAALALDGGKSVFQTLAGTWRLEGPMLDLGEGTAPAKVLAAPERLRLDAEGSSVVLRRVDAD